MVNGENLILDGHTGLVLAGPDKVTINHYEKRQKDLKRHIDELVKLKDTPTVTPDGEPITLQANIEIKEDINALRRVNAVGVGLYRTEFLYMNREDMPTEEQHYENYIEVLAALNGAPLTIRTVDLGADKEVDYEPHGPLAHKTLP